MALVSKEIGGDGRVTRLTDSRDLAELTQEMAANISRRQRQFFTEHPRSTLSLAREARARLPFSSCGEWIEILAEMPIELEIFVAR